MVRALFPRPCLPEDILYALIVMAKSQFIACAGYDVIEANFSPRVNWDNFTVLWKKEIKVIELLTICQILNLVFFERGDNIRLCDLPDILQFTSDFLSCFETRPKWLHMSPFGEVLYGKSLQKRRLLLRTWCSLIC